MIIHSSQKKQINIYINIIVSELKKLFISEYLIFSFEKKIESSEFFIKNDFFLTDGKTDFENGHPTVHIYLKSNEHETMLFFMLCHEIAHILFSRKDYLPFSDFCPTDNSFSLNAIERYRKETNDSYGESLEELICNYLSVLITNKLKTNLSLDLSVINDYQKQYNFIAELTEIFENVSNCFNPLDAIFYENDTGIPYNTFWYNLANYNIGQTIFYYDNIMGNESWMYLNLLIEEFFFNEKKETNPINEINRLKKRWSK